MSWQSLYDAHLTIAGTPVTWREIVGNAFGIASAVGGMRRRVWAWPVGIVGNVLLFTVFAGVMFGMADRAPMLGQAGRQLFFIATSLYGWYAWRQAKRHGDGDASGAAVTPRWASKHERVCYVLIWAALAVVASQIFRFLGAGWPAPDWYFWCDAWIFTGSLLATYAMARGWNDFWLMWIAVDLAGVPELLYSKYYPSAVLYAVYAVFVIYGFFQWLKVSRPSETPAPVRSHEMEAVR